MFFISVLLSNYLRICLSETIVVISNFITKGRGMKQKKKSKIEMEEKEEWDI